MLLSELLLVCVLACSNADPALWCRPHPQHCGAGHTLSIVVQATPSALWCRPHPQHCGADHTLSIVVQATPSALWCRGCHTHCLSCRKSAGSHFRHPALNDVIHRTAHIPSCLEPSGPYRADGKHVWMESL